MTKQVLFVVSSDDDREWLYEVRRALPKAEVITDIGCAADEALLKLSERPDLYQLVVVTLDIAREMDAPVIERGGLELCTEIRKVSAVPIILVVPELTNTLQDLVRGTDPTITPYRVSEDLPSRIRAHLYEYRPPQKRLDVIVFVRDGGLWEYELDGTNFKYKRNGQLRIGEALIMAVTEMSSELAEGASLAYAVSSGKEVPILDKVKWKKSFGKLGEIMMKAFCGDNLLFKEHLSRGIENAGGVKNTRVRFVVDSNYQIAFEALFLPPPSEPHHWLLEAPLLRHLRMPGACEMDLFGVGTAPKRVLVVCADTCGVAQLEGPSPRTLNLDKIRWMRKECEFVAHMLQKLLPSFAKPTIIGADGKPVTAEQLLSVLKKGWDIVHFAGHSYYESDDPNRSGRGYLFVGPEHNPTPLNMETVAPYLKNCRLLYLSSCQSASSSFAVAAGNAGVPVIVGYRWPVGDRHAMMHARLFYRNLDRCRSVEHAFWSTQRTIAKHDSASGNIWASSMLVTAYH